MKKIYLDYASTTPTDPQVIRAMEPYFFEHFGNPSSPHGLGRESQKALETARETLATFLGAHPDEIVFTSGGTESNNHALMGAARALKGKGNHLIVSAIEHHSVLEAATALEKEGFRISLVPVNAAGEVSVEKISQLINDQTILISIMQASNEIGTLQPVAEIGRLARSRKILFHTDCVQTVGHLPVQVNELNCDLLSLAAHKFYGPKGIGALYIRRGTKILNYLFGGDQERGRRASTQNVPGAVGLAQAIQICQSQMTAESELQSSFRDYLLEEIPKRVAGVIVNGHPTQRLPNNAHFSFQDLDSESLLMSLDMVGINASMGSACTSGALEPSHVLRAIGLSDELSLGALRISLGRWNTREDVEFLVEQLSIIVPRLRKLNG